MSTDPAKRPQSTRSSGVQDALRLTESFAGIGLVRQMSRILGLRANDIAPAKILEMYTAGIGPAHLLLAEMARTHVVDIPADPICNRIIKRQ